MKDDKLLLVKPSFYTHETSVLYTKVYPTKCHIKLYGQRADNYNYIFNDIFYLNGQRGDNSRIAYSVTHTALWI